MLTLFDKNKDGHVSFEEVEEVVVDGAEGFGSWLFGALFEWLFAWCRPRRLHDD